MGDTSHPHKNLLITIAKNRTAKADNISTNHSIIIKAFKESD